MGIFRYEVGGRNLFKKFKGNVYRAVKERDETVFPRLRVTLLLSAIP